MWKEHVQVMKHFFMHQFLLESQPCILLVLLDEQTKVQRDCLRTWMPPDPAGSKAHALSLDMLEHGASHDEMDLPEGCFTSGRSIYVSKTCPFWTQLVLRENHRHCSSQPPFSIPVTGIACICFQSSTPGESQDWSSASKRHLHV